MCLIEFQFYIQTEISRARPFFGDVHINHSETNKLFTKTAASSVLNVRVGLSEGILRHLPAQVPCVVAKKISDVIKHGAIPPDAVKTLKHS